MKCVRIFFTIIGMVVVATSPLAAQDPFGGLFNEPSDTMMPTWSGQIGFEATALVDWSAPRQSLISVSPAVELNLSCTGANFTLSIAPHPDQVLTWRDVVDELSVSIAFPWGFVEGGLLRKEWGKGDAVHALDPLNAFDQRFGLLADTKRMKIPQPMILAGIGNGNLRGTVVYEPTFQPHRYAISGPWAIADPAYLALIDQDSIPSTTTLGHGQVAARLDWHGRSIDASAMVFNGYDPRAAFSVVLDPSTHQPVSLGISYTRGTLVGIDAAIGTGPLTWMAEGGLWVSEDGDGTDASKYNSAWVYQLGFDTPIHGTTATIGAHWNGRWVWDFDASNPFDVDTAQSYGNTAYSNSLVAFIDLTLARETVGLRLGGNWQVESGGIVVMPSFWWNVDDMTTIRLEGTLYGSLDDADGVESLFERWSANDTIRLSASCSF